MYRSAVTFPGETSAGERGSRSLPQSVRGRSKTEGQEEGQEEEGRTVLLRAAVANARANMRESLGFRASLSLLQAEEREAAKEAGAGGRRRSEA